MLTNVAKELKDNQHILKSLQSTAMPPIQKNSIVPEKQASKVGDTLEIILMAPLKSDFFASTTEIKVSPTNHHWNCGSITSLSSPFLPNSSKWSSPAASAAASPAAASSKSERVFSVSSNVVSPERAKLNPEKVENLVVVQLVVVQDHELQIVNCYLFD